MSVKGVVYIEDESGKRYKITKWLYLHLKEKGRKLKLIAEAETVQELDKKVGGEVK